MIRVPDALWPADGGGVLVFGGVVIGFSRLSRERKLFAKY
jgi:hypothetical protein